MNNQKDGCGCTLLALVLLVVGVPLLAYVAPQVERYPNLPGNSEQIQQLFQRFHTPSLPSIKVSTGEVFTVSVEQ